MSLSLIKSIEPFPAYNGSWGMWGGAEYGMLRFVYDRGNDEFITGLWLLPDDWLSPLDSIFYNYFFDGETGAFKRLEPVDSYYYLYMSYRLLPWANGSFGQIYASTHNGILLDEQGIEIDHTSWSWKIGGWYSPLFNTWNPAPTDLYVLTYCAERNLVIGINDQDVQVWDMNGTPTLTSQLRLPGSASSIGYENKTYVWFVTEDGIIIKMNYGLDPPRFEMMSSVQENEPDVVAYRTCYDSKRKRVVILKCKEDIGNQNPSVIEFYRPYYVASQITDPVPINRIAGNEVTNFIGHLIGSAGEGVASKLVTASLAEPVEGSLLTNIAPTTQNGSFIVKYQCPNNAYTGTLQLSAETSIEWD
jgi:hypothetical protein